jgi:hypothetical protein
MSSLKRSRAKNTRRPAAKGCDRNLRLVRQAVATIFKNPEIGSIIRKITIDVKNGTWSATVLVNGKAIEDDRKEKAAPVKTKSQNGSAKMRFEFQANSI